MPSTAPTAFSLVNTALNPSDPIHSLNLLQDGLESFIIVRYISVAACCWLFYDRLLNAREEVELVWKAPNSIAKFAFLLYQYATTASLTLFVYSMSGSATQLNDTFCQHLIPTLAVLSVTFGGLADVLAVLHVSALWKRNIKVFTVLAFAFIVTTGAAIICRVIGLSRVTSTIYHNVYLDICAGRTRPRMMAVSWGIGLIFDAIVMVSIFWNAICVSREQKTSVVQELRRGGIGYFLLVSAIRIFNVTLTAAAPLGLLGLVAAISWPLFSVGLSRFIFKLRRGQRTHSKIICDERQPEIPEMLSTMDSLVYHSA